MINILILNHFVQNKMADASVCTSAPGKVLVVGGYLVLQEGTPGLVVSATSRFYAVLSRVAAADASGLDNGAVPVSISSPQFRRDWQYHLVAYPGSGALLLQPAPTAAGSQPDRNVFVEQAVNAALAGAIGVVGFSGAWRSLVGSDWSSAVAAPSVSLHLRLLADNDFYSQRAHLVERGLPVCSASLASLPKCMPCPVDAATGRVQVNKTGLGSSAALTTAVAAAVLAMAGAVTLHSAAGAAAASSHAGASDRPALPAGPSRSLVHACAQLAHGLAQGKVGSGFDVAAASAGSCVYTRVPPSTLGALMAQAEAATEGVKRTAAAGGAGAGAGDADADAAGAAAGFARLCATLVAVAEAESGSSVGAAAASGAGAGAAASPASVAAGEGGRSLASAWSAGVRLLPFALPPGLRLRLADVAGGSETPGMVRQVLAWRDGTAAPLPQPGAAAGAAADVGAAEAEAEAAMVTALAALPAACSAEEVLAAWGSSAASTAAAAHAADAAEQHDAMHAAAAASVGPGLWKGSAAANARAAVVVAQLARLARSVGPAAYRRALAAAAGKQWHAAGAASSSAAVDAEADAEGDADAATAAVLSKLGELAASLRAARFVLRGVGHAAGVPIEPPAQTALADATLALPGVIAAGVPGAGGFDALFALAVAPEELPGDADGAGGAAASASASASPSAAIEALWLGWPGGGLTPLLLSNGPAVSEAGAGVLIDVPPATA